MRTAVPSSVERRRVTRGPMRTNAAYGFNGVFLLWAPTGARLQVIVSDGGGWEHASVVVLDQERTPTWEEMCHVKQMFWHEEEAVVQYHPPRSDYVNVHAHALHLWKPVGVEFPLPPKAMV